MDVFTIIKIFLINISHFASVFEQTNPQVPVFTRDHIGIVTPYSIEICPPEKSCIMNTILQQQLMETIFRKFPFTFFISEINTCTVNQFYRSIIFKYFHCFSHIFRCYQIVGIQRQQVFARGMSHGIVFSLRNRQFSMMKILYSIILPGHFLYHSGRVIGRIAIHHYTFPILITGFLKAPESIPDIFFVVIDGSDDRHFGF